MIIISLIPIRYYLVPRCFKQKELEIMDDFTADNEVVLASLGGRPELPGGARQEEYGLERRHSQTKEGVRRQRAGSFHR